MGLAQIQQALAQFYTNSNLRERFFADPQAVSQELGLSFDEARQLEQLSIEQLELFAGSLKRKRLGEVRELLPFTARVLGKDFSQLFWRYAETYVPQGIKKHKQDAIAFAAFIETTAGVGEIEPPWIVELVRYEKAWLQATEPTRKLTVYRSRYAINKLVQSLAQPNGKPLLLMQPTFVIWFRLARGGSLRYIVLSLPQFMP